MATYRNGESKAAIATFMKGLKLSNAGGSSDFFFLAMAHGQLGEKEEAREWYDKGVTWMKKHKPTDEELKRFRTEAAALLGISESELEPRPRPRKSP